MKEIK
jgi:chromosome segregation ATPase